MNDHVPHHHPADPPGQATGQGKPGLVRGKLRIYFGASSGVGKTFAMLTAAQKEMQSGRDLLVGVVETHGRPETAALLNGLPLLPLRSFTPHDGHLEFDLDGALARKPDLILVDELAHTNTKGHRHPKRWQDVSELLTQGIHVWTTLNVQHLESLNDVIGGITGIRVMETLPDRLLDQADEVVLIDISAEELLTRLATGKVHIPRQAEAGVGHFLHKGNLMALREIALRRLADRVGDDVQNYRVEQSITDVWQTGGGILACVGPGAEHVVRSAARLAGQLNVSWHAVFVETPGFNALTPGQRDKKLEVIRLAEQLQGSVAVLNHDNVALCLVDYARRHNLSRVVVGRDTRRRSYPWRRRQIGDRIANLAPDLDLFQVSRPRLTPQRLVEEEGPPQFIGQTASPRRNYFLAIAACLAITLLTAPLLDFFDLANIVMLFLLMVVLVAVRLGRGPAALAACLGVALFDFFYVPPHFTFVVHEAQYLVTFVVMLTVGLITGQLTAGLRFQAHIARQREEDTRRLFEFARELSGALQNDQVVKTSVSALVQAFGGTSVLLLPDNENRLAPPPLPEHVPFLDLMIAQWALDHNEHAGFATDTLPGNHFRYLPLRTRERTHGILAIRPANTDCFVLPEGKRQLETFTSLIAIALERVHYVHVVQEMLLGVESERLRNSLLAAISHDLRTPLTALVGLADSLQLSKPSLQSAQLEITLAIRESAMRMNALVINLLDMAHIQGGKLQLNREWQSVEEVVGSAIRTLGAMLRERTIHIDLPRDLPLVEFDAVLIERVLANLLENADKYAPPSTPIEISGSVEGDWLNLSIADHGPGVPPGHEEAIFGKFIRGVMESALPGVGLGLAICRAIVEAHDGHIVARNRKEGGALFTLSLPLGTPPEIPSQEMTT